MSEPCTHCLPTKRTNHHVLHLEHYVNAALNFFTRPFRGAVRRLTWLCTPVWHAMIGLFEKIGVVKFVSIPDRNKLFNRTLIFWDEAKRRGIDIRTVTVFGRYVNEFRFTYHGKNYFFEGIPLRIFNVKQELDDKFAVKKILAAHGIPVAKGVLCASVHDAYRAAGKIGYPLVVKPKVGSLSHHVTTLINDPDTLARAVAIALQYKPAFIVERHISGKLYRATVIGRKLVFVCEKIASHVIGDGRSSIADLIMAKNSDPKRGDAGELQYTLHKIPITTQLTDRLKQQEMNLQTVPHNGAKIVLSDKCILGVGCDINGCSAYVHPENRALFLRIAEILGSELVGIDFICSDITIAYALQQTAVLETNSLPFVDMHQYPSLGEPDPVAPLVWDFILERIESAYRRN